MFKESGSDNSSAAETTLVSPTMPSSPTTGCTLDVYNVEVTTLEEAHKINRDLRQRYRIQAQQLLAWKRAYKVQEDRITRLQREKAEQLKCLSSKLILFESRLIRDQKNINTLLNHHKAVIMKQQRIIDALNNRLIENGLETSNPDLTDIDTNMPDMDSLNDSDSAVIMEDIDSDSNLSQFVPRFRSNIDSVTIHRSISDAIDPNLKYTTRRSNGFLRRPEILETVYSVEEDADNENTNENHNASSPSSVAQKRENFALLRSEKILHSEIVNEDANMDSAEKVRLNKLDQPKSKTVDNTPEDDEDNENIMEHNRRESFPNWPYRRSESSNGSETLERQRAPLNQVTTYNRVMSNHRSVTKPKDVKYKRINKAKSKSLEELRGRLKNWVEHGNKLTGISLDQTQSYA